MKASQERQKRYVDLKITLREFHVGDHVYIKVKSTLRLGKCKKLALGYCRPFEILAKVGSVAYQLALPPSIKVHNVFHVSILKRYVHDVSHVIDWIVIEVEREGEFQMGPEHVLDRRELLLRNRTIRKVKVQWKHLSLEEATWELKSIMQEAYPNLFQEDDMHE